MLSLAIGIYYQKVYHDVGTAWIISTYIVAAAASKIYASYMTFVFLTFLQLSLLFLALLRVSDEFDGV